MSDITFEVGPVAGDDVSFDIPVPGTVDLTGVAVVADLVISADEVDGTGDAFSLLLPSAATTGFTVVATIDLATFQSFLTANYPSGATVAVPYGDHPGIYSVTAATADEPWTVVDGSLVATVAGTYAADWLAARVGTGPLTTLYPDPEVRKVHQTIPAPLVDGGVWALTAGDDTSYFSCPVPGPLTTGGIDVRFKVAARLPLPAPDAPGDKRYLEFATIAHPSFSDLDLLELAIQWDAATGVLGGYAEFHRDGDPLEESGEYEAGRIRSVDSDFRLLPGHAWEGAYTIDPAAGLITMWQRVLDNGDWVTDDARHYRAIASKDVAPFDISSEIDTGRTLKVGVHDGLLATAYMEIRDGIDGDLWANLPLDGTTDDAGNTWTIHGTASVVDTTIAGLASGGGGGVALGETSTTAYRGDRGKTAYDHSQVTTGNPHGTTAADLGAATTSRTISAGTGLTGGGDLSADRTLAVTYGLTASTAAEGIALPRSSWRTGSYYGAAIPTVNAGIAMASGVVRAVPFYNPVAGRTIDQIAIDVHSASGTPSGYLYVMLDDGNGYPGASAASGAITPAATSRVTTSASYTLPRGMLWLVGHSTAATWAGLALSGPSPYLPVNATYSANSMNCWQATGAGTSLLTSFPAGGTQSANGMQILVRAA